VPGGTVSARPIRTRHAHAGPHRGLPRSLTTFIVANVQRRADSRARRKAGWTTLYPDVTSWNFDPWEKRGWCLSVTAAVLEPTRWKSTREWKTKIETDQTRAPPGTFIEIIRDQLPHFIQSFPFTSLEEHLLFAVYWPALGRYYYFCGNFRHGFHCGPGNSDLDYWPRLPC